MLAALPSSRPAAARTTRPPRVVTQFTFSKTPERHSARSNTIDVYVVTSFVQVLASEKQTAVDTTVGEPLPMGQRDAVDADTLAEPADPLSSP